MANQLNISFLAEASSVSQATSYFSLMWAPKADRRWSNYPMKYTKNALICQIKHRKNIIANVETKTVKQGIT